MTQRTAAIETLATKTLIQYFTPREVAEMFKVSVDTILRRFAKVPGVLDLGSPERGRKRAYRNLRIPPSALEYFKLSCQAA